MKKRALLALLLLVLAAIPVAAAPYFWRSTAVVSSGQLEDRLVLRAAVVAAEGIAQVAGPATGHALKVPVREGDHVEPGQTLAEIGDGAKGSSTSVITAPIAGSLLVRRIDVGDAVAVASQGGTQALFEIADTAKTEIRAELEERDATRVSVGLGVMLTTPGASAVIGKGVIARVAARIERRTIGADDARVRADGAVRAVWISWQGTPPRTALGQHLEAHVSLPPKSSATRVPRSAIIVREGRTVVETPLLLWSREVPVEVGVADEALAEVRGVAPGTRVFLH
jgi:multidrug efflux pump subunit AcrA (membrane-fusion protein)